MLKRLRYFILISIAVLSFSTTAQELSKKEKKANKRQKQFEQLQEVVNKDSLEIVFNHCTSSKMGYIDLTTNPNYLKLRNDSAYAYLPYFGVAYRARMDSKGGIQFEDIRYNEKITVNDKKKQVLWFFEGKNDFDQYKCTLTLFPNGTATLVVISNYYQSITYDGEIKDFEIRD